MDDATDGVGVAAVRVPAAPRAFFLGGIAGDVLRAVVE